MNEQLGTLITCPTCEKVGKKHVLGRLLPDGIVEVLRFHHGTTRIDSSGTITIACGCGYSIYSYQGAIITQP